MNYRRLGRSGLQVSELSIGSWVTYGTQVDHRAARESLEAQARIEASDTTDFDTYLAHYLAD